MRCSDLQLSPNFQIPLDRAIASSFLLSASAYSYCLSRHYVHIMPYRYDAYINIQKFPITHHPNNSLFSL